MSLNAIRKLSWFRVMLAAEIVFALVVAGGLWLLRAQTLEGEARMLDALARAMAQQADRTLGIGQVALKITGDELSRGLIAPSGPQTDALLRERIRTLPGFRAISLFDAEGHRVATSRDASSPPPATVESRDFHRAARAARSPQLFLSKPYVGRLDDEPSVSLSIAWFDAQGRFAGVVALVAEPGFLSGSLSHIASDKDVRAAVLRRNAAGKVVDVAAGAPATQPEADIPPGLRGAFDEAGQPHSLPAGMLEHGDRRVLATAVPLHELPLVQVVWRDTDAILTGWNELAWLVFIVVVAMLAVSLLGGLRRARDQLKVEALEQRLTRNRKLEALGQLAGGVAHDFNNVLAAVVGFGEMARQAAGEGSRQAHHLDQVLQAAERGRQQVERILAFSRGQPRRSVSFLLQPVLQEVLDHLSTSKRAQVHLVPDLKAPDLAVRGDATAVYEAVMNLCTNALQAMPEGGTLAVSLDSVHLAQPRQTYDTTLPAGRYARLQVQDTGSGMSADVLAHLFEPFFTTKGRHGGTGIGLAVVHGVVADLGGGIDVDSTPGRGTHFTLLLPLSQEPVQAHQADVLAMPLGQGEAILIVDDEPALVELAEEMLADLGYDPHGTVSSAHALQALRDDPSRFDLVLTDEVMPELSGIELARKVRELRPDLPVVLASGYGGEQFEARAAEAGVRMVLTKPLTRRAVAEALQRALRGL